MQGSVVVITGGSSGVGCVSAQTLVALGAQVILVVRDPIKCADAAAAIQSSPDNVKSLFEVADLSLLT
jgi:NAD(P)-dependent dehydrogenase (short-subunit alcohol dehydrogenase family)